MTDESKSPDAGESAAQQTEAPQVRRPSGGLEELDAEALRARYLRLAADFENARRQQRRELERQRRQVRDAMVRDWLAVVDSVDRALEAKAEVRDEWYEGLLGIRRQVDEVLRKQGVRRMQAEGQPFDPRIHEAVSTQYDAERPDMTVIAVDQTGYLRDDGSVVRPARVIVSKQPPAGPRA